MYETTRTITVMGGGALGSMALGGHVGAAVGGIAGGVVTDVAATIITDKPHGYVETVGDMGRDITNGRIPFESGGRTLVLAATDAAGGIAGAAMINSRNVGSLATLAYRSGRVVTGRS